MSRPKFDYDMARSLIYDANRDLFNLAERT